MVQPLVLQRGWRFAASRRSLRCADARWSENLTQERDNILDSLSDDRSREMAAAVAFVITSLDDSVVGARSGCVPARVRVLG